MTLARLLQIFAMLVLSLALVGVADAQRDRKKKEEAAALYPNATREDPKIKPSSRVSKQLMKMYELSQEDDHAKTLEAAEKVLSNKAAGAYEKSLALQTIGFVHVDREEYPQAIDYLEKSLAAGGLSNDNHYQIMMQVGQLYLADDNYDKALEVFNRFLTETRSEKPEHLALVGNVHYRMENYEKAAELLGRAVAATEDPQNSWLQLLMGSYFELGREQDAAKIAESLLAKDPNDIAMIRNLAAIYMNQDANEQALEILSSAKQRGLLTEERDYTQLYQLYHYMEREADAIATIEEGLQKGILKPSMELYRTIGEAAYFSDKPEQAADAYRKAAELAKDGEMSLNLARVLMELEKYEEAKKAANDALGKGIRRRGDAYIIIGGAELEMDRQDAAVAAYKEAAKYEETKSAAESWLRSSGIR